MNYWTCFSMIYVMISCSSIKRQRLRIAFFRASTFAFMNTVIPLVSGLIGPKMCWLMAVWIMPYQTASLKFRGDVTESVFVMGESDCNTASIFHYFNPPLIPSLNWTKVVLVNGNLDNAKSFSIILTHYNASHRKTIAVNKPPLHLNSHWREVELYLPSMN